jgi:leucyl/phenylalanyl-tRNA--protein transferase
MSRRTRLDPDRPTPELLIEAYARGIFPMADPDSGGIGWFSPDPRAVFPLDRFHVPKSVARAARSGRFELATDTRFEAVMRECAAPGAGRERTWIDERLVSAYVGLHRLGLAHSIEASRGGELVGGLYGVHLGGAFFGESMFTRPERGGTDASKVCLVRLVEVLRAQGFRLLDTQFWTPHLARFGCTRLRRGHYLALLADALSVRAGWPPAGPLPSGDPPSGGEKGGASAPAPGEK